jgi:TPR repeat protein
MMASMRHTHRWPACALTLLSIFLRCTAAAEEVTWLGRATEAGQAAQVVRAVLNVDGTATVTLAGTAMRGSYDGGVLEGTLAVADEDSSLSVAATMSMKGRLLEIKGSALRGSKERPIDMALVQIEPHWTPEDYSRAGVFAMRGDEYSPRDVEVARVLLKEAAEHGAVPAALRELGFISETIDRDLGAAERLYGEAAMLGDTIAKANLGIFFLYGKTGAPDLARATLLLNAAADAGSPNAHLALALMHSQQEFGKIDFALAEKHARAALPERELAASVLGRVEEWRGNLGAALMWYERALAAGAEVYADAKRVTDIIATRRAPAGEPAEHGDPQQASRVSDSPSSGSIASHAGALEAKLISAPPAAEAPQRVLKPYYGFIYLESRKVVSHILSYCAGSADDAGNLALEEGRAWALVWHEKDLGSGYPTPESRESLFFIQYGNGRFSQDVKRAVALRDAYVAQGYTEDLWPGTSKEVPADNLPQARGTCAARAMTPERTRWPEETQEVERCDPDVLVLGALPCKD